MVSSHAESSGLCGLRVGVTRTRVVAWVDRRPHTPSTPAVVPEISTLARAAAFLRWSLEPA